MNDPILYGDEQVVAIEYHATQYKAYGRKKTLIPFSVFTIGKDHPGRNKGYDFEWCRRDQSLYFNQTSSGISFYLSPLSEPEISPRVAVWWDRNATFPTDSGNEKKRLSDKTVWKWGYEILNEPVMIGEHFNPFAEACHGDTEYCSRCNDHLPTDSPCTHIWFCDKCGCFSSPQDRCGHKRS